MDFNLEQILEQILKGEISSHDAQKYLAEISEDDLSLISEERLQKLIMTGRDHNQYTPKPLPSNAERKKAQIWNNITAPEKKQDSLFKKALNGASQFLSSFSQRPLARYGVVIAGIMIIIMIPFFTHQVQDQEFQYYGFKGDGLSDKTADLEYAITDDNGLLARVSRSLTEKDSLAFRMTVEREGYYTIACLYGDNMDLIILDEFFAPGVHDLEMAYALSGNKGKNRLVQIFSMTPIHPEPDNMKDQLLALLNKDISLTAINDVQVSIKYRELNIN